METSNKGAAQAREDIKAKDLEMGSLVRRLNEEERERQALSRKEKSKIQREYE